MASLIASTAAQADSSDFALTGTGTTLSLVSASGNIGPDVSAAVQYKAASGSYTTIGVLTASLPAQVLTASGTYRVRKYASASAAGVDRD